jgi:hypothetical protein
VVGKVASAVAGKGYLTGKAPLSGEAQYEATAMALKALRGAVKRGYADPQGVVKGLSPEFTSQFGMFLAGMPSMGGGGFMSQLNAELSDLLGKNVTLTSPISTGIVPFDLVAPSALIYPVYSPVRNRLARVPGQGTSRQRKIITGITGSRTGAQGAAARISMGEFPAAQTLANWPMNLPPSGAQTGVDLNVPYKFMGKSEALSWLAQFAGAGYEDGSALANLFLMQEMMMGEEDMIFSATGTALSAPTAPTVVMRAAGSNEAAITGYNTHSFICLTAVNYYGETVMSTRTAQDITAGQVIDVTITPVRGAFTYRIYMGQSAGADPGRAAEFFVAEIGAHKYTIQGVVPSSGAVPPAADSGTASTNDYEGLLSILDGHAVTDAAIYPAGFQAGYINKSVNNVLNTLVVNTMLQQLWDGPGAYRANPSEIIGEAYDLVNLAESIAAEGSAGSGYRMFIEQAEVSGIRAGQAVSEFVNPVTRSILRMVVHPTMPQGTAIAMSYTLPNAWSNVSNVVEMVMVQDYLSVSWPVIDASFRYSIFAYGALVMQAPQYCGLLQGLQKSAVAPYA